MIFFISMLFNSWYDLFMGIGQNYGYLCFFNLINFVKIKNDSYFINSVGWKSNWKKFKNYKKLKALSISRGGHWDQYLKIKNPEIKCPVIEKLRYWMSFNRRASSDIEACITTSFDIRTCFCPDTEGVSGYRSSPGANTMKHIFT